MFENIKPTDWIHYRFKDMEWLITNVRKITKIRKGEVATDFADGTRALWSFLSEDAARLISAEEADIFRMSGGIDIERTGPHKTPKEES